MTAAGPPRICFVSCAAWPNISESDAFAQRALEARGATVVARAWNRPGERFDGFDVAVFRSNWDYHHTPEAFLAWLARWEAAGVAFWNPPALVRWNLSKRYLVELAAAGVPVVPTLVLEGEEARRLPAIMRDHGWAAAVVKPLVSASAHDTTLVHAGEAAAVARAVAEGRIRRPVLVQPFLREIQEDGEWSLVFVDGRFTHAALKHPAPGDFRVQPRFGGRSSAAHPDAATLVAARRVLDALPVEPLYARIDGVPTTAGFVVMEVEVHEPGLFFPLAPAAAQTFADAVLLRVRRTRPA